MSILVNKNTRVVVQGITGKEGSFHATQCKAYGTKVVAGVTPGKAGQEVEGLLVADLEALDLAAAAVDVAADDARVFGGSDDGQARSDAYSELRGQPLVKLGKGRKIEMSYIGG